MHNIYISMRCIAMLLLFNSPQHTRSVRVQIMVGGERVNEKENHGNAHRFLCNMMFRNIYRR
jgi:hypothetical protein